jgi:hypothetical protein
MGADANPEFKTTAPTTELRPPGAEAAAEDITRDAAAFTSAIRAKIFAFLRWIANREFDEALAMLSTAADAEEAAWTPERLRTTDEAYHAGHRGFLLDPAARNLRNTLITKSGPEAASPHWIVRQILVDAEDLNDWMLEFEIDLPASRAAKQPDAAAVALVRVDLGRWTENWQLNPKAAVEGLTGKSAPRRGNAAVRGR